MYTCLYKIYIHEFPVALMLACRKFRCSPPLRPRTRPAGRWGGALPALCARGGAPPWGHLRLTVDNDGQYDDGQMVING